METPHAALIVTFARPDGLKRLIEIGITSGITRFYIAIDGARTEAHREAQSRMHLYLKELNGHTSLKIYTWQREVNLGAAVSVLSAINWFFLHEQAGYILEDDLVPSNDFFLFASRALELYERNPDVWVVAGSRMNPADSNSSWSTWSNYPMIWGWATWAYKWEKMFKALLELEPLSTQDFFNARKNFWHFGARRAQNGLVDAWDIPLANAQKKIGKYTVIPPVNLVTNIGFDLAATHTSGSAFPLNHPTQALPVDYNFKAKTVDLEAKNYDKELESKLFKIKRHHSFLGVYSHLLDMFKFKNTKKGSLNQRLGKVKTPS